MIGVAFVVFSDGIGTGQDRLGPQDKAAPSLSRPGLTQKAGRAGQGGGVIWERRTSDCMCLRGLGISGRWACQVH